MTVDELLSKIIRAYPGATPEALATFKPVFLARFQKREGPHLAAAFNDCCAVFKPTARQPFPIPVDIEAHMPSLGKPDEKGEKPIRDLMARRAARARILLEDWLKGQGARIRDARPRPLYAACFLEAEAQAKLKALDDRVSAVVLDQAKVNECFQRAISSERVRRHGRLDRLSPQAWWTQIEEIARGWNLEITPAWWSEGAAAALDPQAAKARGEAA